MCVCVCARIIILLLCARVRYGGNLTAAVQGCRGACMYSGQRRYRRAAAAALLIYSRAAAVRAAYITPVPPILCARGPLRLVLSSRNPPPEPQPPSVRLRALPIAAAAAQTRYNDVTIDPSVGHAGPFASVARLPAGYFRHFRYGNTLRTTYSFRRRLFRRRPSVLSPPTLPLRCARPPPRSCRSPPSN